jgi:hypothetical protein
MKVLLSISLLFIVFNACSQQHEIPFPDSNAVWIQHRAQPVGVPPNYTYDHCYYKVFSHDTTHLNGEVYNNLYFDYYYDPIYNFEVLWEDVYMYQHIGLFRTDSLKVFYKPVTSSITYPCFIGNPFDDTDPDAEFLLYDFGLNIGDTFNVQIDQQIVLETIDSVEINGTYYRKFNFDQINWYSGGYYHWIEGIGSQLGFFPYFDGFENYLGFECFHEDPDSTWINPSFSYSQYLNGCDFVGLDEIQNYTTKIYPNPASDYVKIELVNPSKITIMNLWGQNLIEVKGSEGVNQINIAHLAKGLYFIQIDSSKHPFIIE